MAVPENQAGSALGQLHDLEKAQELIADKRRVIGPRYDEYLNRTAVLLRDNFPQMFQAMTDDNLRNFIAVVDISGGPSRGQMKRWAEACDGCGWCCSQTSRIVVTAEDVERISKALKQKPQTFFIQDGKDWVIKQAHPCGWWNPRNGRCAIYNIRPYTCRVWPQTTDQDGKHALQEMPECRYSVTVLAARVVDAIREVSTAE
ncbi:protein of unknown function UPF0153 [Dehalogenimonas lykanthroporepellens BL-DC-9]|nr:protein of unknown function UPF0153 [Dehalogenimonas lykanthroporepellens BL-DC-9]